MFGIQDPWIVLVYILCVLSTLLCVVYGALNWNSDGDIEPQQEDKEWAREEDELIKKL